MDGLEQAPEEQYEAEEELQHEEQTEEQPQYTEDEQKAMSGGWTPKDQWVESGHDPDEWRTAKSFNQWGEMLDSLKTLQKNQKDSETKLSERLENQRKALTAQHEAKMIELQAQRELHVENGDVEAFNATQKQIDSLTPPEKPEPSTVADPNKIVSDYNAANPWIRADTEKAAYARDKFGQLSSTMPVDQAIQQMERIVREKYPEVNERRMQPNRAEAPRRTVNKKPSKPTMTSVKPDHNEMKIKHLFASEDAFLQAVLDSRG